MKKMLKKASALTLTSALVLSSVNFAFATATPVPSPGSAGAVTTLEGKSAFEAAILQLVVPANFDFTIDPMKITGETQIHSNAFLLVNKSNVPVEASMKITAPLAAAGKPSIKTEDEVLAASADITKTEKLYSLYVAPIIKSTLAAGGVTLTSADGDNEFAKPTSYIGVGTTGATFSTVLDASDEFTTTWAAPDANGEDTFDAFQFVGSVNKNAAWAANDVKVGVVYQFQGMATDDYTNTFAPLKAYQNITKAASGTGSVVVTPRFREKIQKTDGTAAVTVTVELGATAANYYKGLATHLGTELVIGALTVTKNGVADTTSLKITGTDAVTFAVNADDDDPEKGLVGTLTIPAATALALTPDSTYVITGITLKGTTATPTFVSVAGANTTILRTAE